MRHRPTRSGFAIAVLPLVLVGALSMGCGAKDNDKDQITDVTKQFAADAKDKDWKGVCGALSTKAKAQMATAGALLGGGDDCAALFAKLLALDDSADSADSLGKIDPDKIKINDIKITGDSATAKVTPTSDEDPTTRYVREDGDWKIDIDPDDSSSSKTTGDDSDDQSAATPAPRLQVSERGFSRLEGGDVSYGMAVRNPGADDAAEVDVQINLVAADGGVAATESETLTGIPAGDTVYVGGDTDPNGDRVTRLEITVKAESAEDAGTVKLPRVSRVKLSPDDLGFSVRAQVTNTLDEALSSLSDVYAVLRGSDGKIVGGLSGYPDSDIDPGGRSAVTLQGLNNVTGATRADVTADAETSG